MTLFDPSAIYQRAECLFSQEQISAVIEKIAAEINLQFVDKNPIVISILNGGLILTGQLLTQLNFPLQVDYLHASRYQNKIRGESLHWKTYPQLDLNSRHILLVDDILDEGYTLVAVKEYCLGQQAASVQTLVLADKKHQRKAQENLKADFTGLEIPDRFVFGYGLDYQGYWRNAPGIFALHKEDEKS
ncbi:MAG: hypoxanthine-guanine phosphoribosyltransferase [Gammaproteobacteria bacterium CG22_combo_CG10-13_8_21_14_all_40_8]|nr:MAG: hypoxanthine-guanine phosphoribosyltransferase [Gammaproteobacteria bacterium CG22_combo_CG10-13_8_21_14_all_40_8]